MTAAGSPVSAERTSLSGRWTVRPGACTARFAVRDKLLATVHGSLPVVAGEVEVSPDGAVLLAYVEVGVSGIATGNVRRDKDLRKPGFLDVERHPEVRVAATDVTPTRDGWMAEALVHARGRSAPVSLIVQPGEDGGDGLSVRVTGRLDRAPLGIRVPTFIVGRFIDLDATLTLQR